MESLLTMVESLPIWVKILIPFVGSFIYYVTYDLIKCDLGHIKVVDDIKISIKTVLYNIPAYICVIIILGIAQLVLNIWDISIWPFNGTYTKIGNSLRIIKSSGAKITFCNMNPKKSATLDNMRRIAAQVLGLIIYDIVIDAGFEAEKLAASGACFVCNCSNGSTCIPDIAKESKGHVTFVNCNSPRIRQIRELGGAYVEFQ